jgi:hypothetical protein
MPRPPKLPFDALPGLPSDEDEDVIALMEAVERLPREGANEIARCLLRAALGYERAEDTRYLTCLAEDALFTMRLRSHPQTRDSFNDEPRTPAKLEGASGQVETFARRGMT